MFFALIGLIITVLFAMFVSSAALVVGVMIFGLIHQVTHPRKERP